MNAVSTTESITQKSGSNFLLAFKVLSPEQQKAMTVFYAFSRLIDDAVDEHPSEQARKLLLDWEQDIKAIYSEGEVKHPVAVELAEVVREYEIPQEYLFGMIEGMAMDLESKSYASLEELLEYCYRAAALVGLVCMKIFAYDSDLSRKAAVELGYALQLTNIIRDVSVDAQINRIYLPADLMEKHCLDSQKLVDQQQQQSQPEELAPLLSELSKQAYSFYDQAFAKLKQLDRKKVLSAWIMGKIYFALLKKMESKNFNVFKFRFRLSRFRKIWIALKEWLRK